MVHNPGLLGQVKTYQKERVAVVEWVMFSSVSEIYYRSCNIFWTSFEIAAILDKTVWAGSEILISPMVESCRLRGGVWFVASPKVRVCGSTAVVSSLMWFLLYNQTIIIQSTQQRFEFLASFFPICGNMLLYKCNLVWCLFTCPCHDEYIIQWHNWKFPTFKIRKNGRKEIFRSRSLLLPTSWNMVRRLLFYVLLCKDGWWREGIKITCFHYVEKIAE